MTTPAEIFQELPKYFQPDQAGTATITYAFDLTGPDGGQWWVAIANGQCTSGSGPATNPTVTFSAADQVFVDVIEGKVNPTMAYMQGQLKIQGDLGTAARLTSLFKRP